MYMTHVADEVATWVIYMEKGRGRQRRCSATPQREPVSVPAVVPANG